MTRAKKFNLTLTDIKTSISNLLCNEKAVKLTVYIHVLLFTVAEILEKLAHFMK